MPDRILRADFGEDALELDLSLAALGAYTFISRAFDNFGCAKNNKRIIRAKAFPGRTRPNQHEVDSIFEEYRSAGLTEERDGWIYLTRWFRDNRFRSNRKTVAPRPEYIADHVTEQEWADVVPDKFSAAAKALGSNGTDEDDQEPPAAAVGRQRPPKGKKPKGKELKEVLTPSGFPETKFIDLFRQAYGHKPRDLQMKRAEEWYKEYGWPKLKDAINEIGGDYGFKYVQKVLDGDWNKGKGKDQDKPGRHAVDDR